MTELISYLVEASLVLALGYGFYWLLLRKLTTFTWNRWFLVGIGLTALLLPLVEIPGGLAEGLPSYTLPTVDLYTEDANGFAITGWGIVSAIYLWGAGWFLLRILIGYVRLRWLMARPNRQKQAGYWLVELDDNQPSFSFLNYLFLNEELNTESREAVVAHELAHIRQGHTYDLLFLHLIQVVFWFNPFVYLLKRSLVTVHEYLADAAASGQGERRDDYSRLLVAHTFQVPAVALSHAFFHQNLLKTRIQMIYQQPTSKVSRWRYLLIVPLMACIFMTVACEPEVQQPATADQAEANLKVYADVDQMPEYPGGMAEMGKVLGAKIKYPKEAKKAEIEGKVMIAFVIDVDGSVINAQVKKGLGYGCDEVALAAVESLAKWKPGMKDGKPVRTQLTLPIKFELTDD